MKQLNTLLNSLIGLSLSLVVATPVLAATTDQLYNGLSNRTDDTEIFYGALPSGGLPNIVFVIDTSGSMRAPIIARTDYDPNTLYAGPCEAYRYDTSVPPIPISKRYYYEYFPYSGRTKISFAMFPDGADGPCQLENSIPASLMQCQAAATSLNEKGYYIDKFVLWDPIQGKWVNPQVLEQGPLDTTKPYYNFFGGSNNWSRHGENPFWDELDPTNANAYLECRSDLGIEGVAGDTVNVYPSLGATPFSTVQTPNFYTTPAYGYDPEQPIDTTNLERLGGDNSYALIDGNFLNYVYSTDQEGYSAVQRKLNVVKRATTNLFENINDYNISLVIFNSRPQGQQSSDGGIVIAASDSINGPHRDFLIEQVDGLGADAYTPISEVLYETYLHLTGGEVKYGDQPGISRRDYYIEDGTDDPVDYTNTVNFTSVPESRDPNNTDNYLSPIAQSCQDTSIILLTDGEPTRDGDADVEINSLLAGNPALTDQTCSYDSGDNCLNELTQHMFTADMRPGPDVPEDQIVRTFTIGFDTSQMSNAALTLLEEAATGTIIQEVVDPNTGQTIEVVRPGFFEANSAEELLEAFEISSSVAAADSGNVTAPSLSVNNYNRFQHFDDLIFSLYEPAESNTPRWDGNIKRYKVDYVNNELKILGQNGEVAVNDNGSFNDNVRSFWSLEIDGSDVLKGGLANIIRVLGGETRNVYTHISNEAPADPASCGMNGCAAPNFDEGQTVNITEDFNRIEPSKADALYSSFWNGLINPFAKDKVVDWLMGIDPEAATNPDPNVLLGDGRRHAMGDSLHSSPLLINFASGNADPNLMLFAMTNDGYFHAAKINASLNNSDDDTLLQYSFIPRDLMPRTAKLYNNAFGAVAEGLDRDYGLDGDLSYIINGDDGNNVVDSGEQAWVFMGMGRGGRNYYGLEVNDTGTLKQKWIIRGGTGDFEELGFTWSKPIASKIKYGANEKDVLLFGGGMDPNKDTRNRSDERGPDIAGRAIYMVDADNGDLLWYASNDASADLPLTEMTHSIPSDLRTVDMNRDGLVDRIYVGDTGGQLWRLDISNEDGDTNLLNRISGGVIARTGAPGELGRRMIFQPPSVAKVNNDFGNYLAITFGTGHASHPLEREVQDRLYMVRDPYVFTVPGGSVQAADYGTPANALSLQDITDWTTPTQDQINSLFVDKKGWYIDFDQSQGEKSLSSPVVLDGSIFFTTYLPEQQEISCSSTPALGGSRFYQISLITGVSRLLDDNGDIIEERYQGLALEGLPPPPVPIFTEPPVIQCAQGDTDCIALQRECPNETSHISLLVGTQIKDPGICNAPIRTYWFEENTDGPDISGDSNGT